MKMEKHRKILGFVLGLILPNFVFWVLSMLLNVLSLISGFQNYGTITISVMGILALIISSLLAWKAKEIRNYLYLGGAITALIWLILLAFSSM